MAKKINSYFPRSGRILREDDRLFNVADYYAWKEQYDLRYETIFNGAFVASIVLDTPASPINFGISVPVGSEFVLYDRLISLNNGDYLIEVFSGGFTGGTDLLFNAFNTDANPVSKNTNFKYNVIPDAGLVKKEESIVVTGTDQNEGRTVSGALDSDNVFKVFKGGTSGVLRVTRLAGTGSFYAGFHWVCWEQPEQ